MSAGNGGRLPLGFALVQHAHQQLITDGYDNREGISDIIDAFSAVLELHARHRVPLNLHLSGMLIEAIAWHRPAFFDLVRRLVEAGLVELLGSSYAQNILPLFSEEHNLRGINEELSLIERHLGCPPEAVQLCWLPERVWDASVGRLLSDHRLLNGGFRAVVVDDRLRYGLRDSAYEGSDRERFDAAGPPFAYQYAASNGSDPQPAHDLDRAALRPWRIAGAGGLVALPIAADLRYAIPPRTEERWQRLRRFVAAARGATTDAIAVYGDDLEKSAVVGPWGSGRWEREGLRYYEDLLVWLRADAPVEPVLLSRWLASLPEIEERETDHGAFYELAHPMGAGEDYQGWWSGAAWTPYRDYLEQAEAALCDAEAAPLDPGLVELGWKQVLASAYETAWHELDGAGQPVPASWARASASHARDARVLAAAAAWPAERDGDAHAELVDLNGDGEPELVLKNDSLFAVFSPLHGGRLVYLFDLTGVTGRLVIGNPADSWNWQEELNRFMDRPSSHPGALCEAGYEHDRYEPGLVSLAGQRAEVVLTNVERSSPLAGTTKRLRVDRGAGALRVDYTFQAGGPLPQIDFAFSPDYLALLREGAAGVEAEFGASYRGWRHAETRAWVAIEHGAYWRRPAVERGSHYCVISLQPERGRVALWVGIGAPVAELSALHGERLSTTEPV